ncbi:hypothetical protein ANN_25577 [Periplaneta americana]|uniref:Uncharacterized protein n=1 Tax=Periplaneta americana TaxID=6978 RepID=A0ABQ8S1E9_PERAM|nr:hypothetical protein ANN_25577 [Periplaneta americana]
MDPSEPCKKIVITNPGGQRRRGRPHIWIDGWKRMPESWGALEGCYKDRDGWRLLKCFRNTSTNLGGMFLTTKQDKLQNTDCTLPLFPQHTYLATSYSLAFSRSISLHTRHAPLETSWRALTISVNIISGLLTISDSHDLRRVAHDERSPDDDPTCSTW